MVPCICRNINENILINFVEMLQKFLMEFRENISNNS